MTLTRLLAASLLACSTLAFAQQQTELLPTPAQTSDASNASAVASPEPWQVVRNLPTATSTRNPLDQMQVDKYKVSRSKANASTLLLGPQIDSGMVLSSLAGQADGTVTTCLKIRSYVVARDSKDSDSTHPVSYSTCQPSSRYQLRTTEMHSGFDGR